MIEDIASWRDRTIVAEVNQSFQEETNKVCYCIVYCCVQLQSCTPR